MRRLFLRVRIIGLSALAGILFIPARTQTRSSADALDAALLQWPLPHGEERYGAIDGKHLHGFVVEQSAISRRYRDQGHPKFWGRIIGTSGDAESAEWLAEK